MPRRSSYLFPLALFLAFPNAASADSDSGTRAVENVSAKGLDQIVYKGFVGNALDGIPMDPSKRVSLQRTNAIVSNTLSGRTLAVLAGLSNPVLLLGGLAWGVWSASNIKPEEDGAQTVSEIGRSGGESAAHRGTVALLDNSNTASRTIAFVPSQSAIAASPAAAESDDLPRVRSAVVKIWLPQRPSN